MTSITETLAPRRRSGYGLVRPSLVSFVAGVALASGVAVGINVISDSHHAATPVVTTIGPAAPAATGVLLTPSPDLRCRVVPGPC